MSQIRKSHSRKQTERLWTGAACALLLALAPAAALAAEDSKLAPFQAQYRAMHGGVSAEGSRKLEARPDGLWQLSNEARILLFRMEESSIITAARDGLRPVRYRLHHPFRSSRSADWLFDWEEGRVYDRGRQGWEIGLDAPLFDPLSYQLQLQLDACAHPGVETKTETEARWEYPVIDRGRLRTYEVTLNGRERLQTAVGQIDTLHLIQRRQGRDREVHIWLAPDWGCLLVRLEQQDGDDGDDAEQHLELLSATVDGRRVEGQ